MLFDESSCGFGIERAAMGIDIHAIGLRCHGDDFGSELAENQRCNGISCAISAIDDDLQSMQRNVVGGVLGELDVATACILDACGLANFVRWSGGLGRGVREDEVFDLLFEFIRKLVAIGSENFQAIVFVGIVRCREHDACGAAHRLRQVSDRWSGQGTDEQHIHTRRNQAAGECCF